MCTMALPLLGARVWSMTGTTAGLVPCSASRRLSSHEGDLEYFIYINGHLQDLCLLVYLFFTEDEQALVFRSLNWIPTRYASSFSFFFLTMAHELTRSYPTSVHELQEPGLKIRLHK